MEDSLPNRDLAQSNLPLPEPNDYERLVRFLVSPEPRFALALARYSDPAIRDGLITQALVDAHAAGTQIATLDLRDLGPSADLLKQFRDTVEGSAAGTRSEAICVINMEPLLLDATGNMHIAPAVEGLNRIRDVLPERIPARIVLWLSDAGADALARGARDLYDVALTFFRFEIQEWPRAITQYQTLPAWIYLASPGDEPRLRREVSLLEQVFERATEPRAVADAAARIGQVKVLLGDLEEGEVWIRRAVAEVRKHGIRSAEPRLRIRLGDLQQLRGELDSAVEQYRTAVDLYRRAGDEGAQAVAVGRIANILEARGQLDEALRIHQEEQLPVFERLGDVRSRAVTWGQIADILEARGQLDEALRIRQEEELPVYERLGDVRSRAITWGQIAEILRARGQLDEALRIRQEEQLPAFERLGDAQGLLVAQAKTAAILLKRNLREDRDRARKLLCLALVSAEKLRIPEADEIRGILRQANLACP